jgi:1-aminocyclopropane-1-carboxylate deaminase/D-cysteine desulfhydrase-like pyridoxal-dependent ACC family enzyme
MPAPVALPSLPLAPYVTPVEELARLRRALGGGPRLLVKRDDAIPFAFGGNKVRKMRLVGADAAAAGADTLITAGGLQSNHARVTAATAATLGMQCVLVLHGKAPARATGNTLLDGLLGAQIEYVERREDRAAAMESVADRLRSAGRRPYIIPIGASNPLGATAFAQAVDELKEQGVEPQTIVHSTSSGGTQAGLIAGSLRAGLSTRIIGISADSPSGDLAADIEGILRGMGTLVGVGGHRLEEARIEIDDRFVGEGYGIATPESVEALELAALLYDFLID